MHYLVGHRVELKTADWILHYVLMHIRKQDISGQTIYFKLDFFFFNLIQTLQF